MPPESSTEKEPDHDHRESPRGERRVSRKPLYNPGPRGTCAVCGRVCFLRKDGNITRHGVRDAWPPGTCPGWSQPPAKNLVDPDVSVIADVLRARHDLDSVDDLAAAISTALKTRR
jgi:hypothetical protein